LNGKDGLGKLITSAKMENTTLIKPAKLIFILDVAALKTDFDKQFQPLATSYTQVTTTGISIFAYLLK